MEERIKMSMTPDIMTDEGVRDVPETRYLDLDNGNRAVFSRDRSQYGFWSIRYEVGGKPTDLSGQYTSYNLAVAAFNQYLDTKNSKRYTEVKVTSPNKGKSKTSKSELFHK